MERENERAEKHHKVGRLKAHKVDTKIDLGVSLDFHTTVEALACNAVKVES